MCRSIDDGYSEVSMTKHSPTTLEIIERTQAYLDYIKEHVMNVRKAWGVLQEKCKDMRFMWDDFYYFSISDSVDFHDLSKLSEHEFVQYRKSFYPADGEPKFDLTLAWEHHKNNNAHHWENWTSLNLGDCQNWNWKWKVHCVHMVIDWMAMGYKFGDTAQDYYEKNKSKINLPEWAITFIYEIFERIK